MEVQESRSLQNLNLVDRFLFDETMEVKSGAASRQPAGGPDTLHHGFRISGKAFKGIPYFSVRRQVRALLSGGPLAAARHSAQEEGCKRKDSGNAESFQREHVKMKKYIAAAKAEGSSRGLLVEADRTLTTSIKIQQLHLINLL